MNSILREKILYAINSEFYKNKFNHINYSNLESLDFKSLPFTTKDELRGTPLLSTLAQPMESVRRVHSSSGTKGLPTFTYYTEKDLFYWSTHLHKAFKSGGLSSGDIFQTIVGFGLFSGGLGFQMAAESYGMTVIPAGTGNTERQVKMLKEFCVNSFITISSYIPVLKHYMESIGFNPKLELNLKVIFIGAEPFNPQEKNIWEDFFGVPILGIYGMSEIEGPGISYECPSGNGMHICEDDFYVEIIAPNNGSLLSENEEGEIVVTTLKREAMPLVRFRTGDISKIYHQICPCCGRNVLKMDYVRHRTDDMFIVKGVNVYPHEIENIIFRIQEVHNAFKIIISNDSSVKLQLAYIGESHRKKEVEAFVKSEIKKWLYITTSIEWSNIGTLLNSLGKRVLVIDERR